MPGASAALPTPGSRARSLPDREAMPAGFAGLVKSGGSSPRAGSGSVGGRLIRSAIGDPPPCGCLATSWEASRGGARVGCCALAAGSTTGPEARRGRVTTATGGEAAGASCWSALGGWLGENCESRNAESR